MREAVISVARGSNAIGACLMACSVVLVGCGQPAGMTTSVTPAERRAAIYATVLGAFLKDAPKASAPPSDAYVVDRAIEKAGWGPRLERAPSQRIGTAVQRSLTEKMAGTAALTWISDQDRVLVRPVKRSHLPSCFLVRDGELVITLDRLPETGDRLEVSVSAVGHEFSRNDCAVGWMKTYVINRDGEDWQVTRTTNQGVT